jgi:hypothetical protein
MVVVQAKVLSTLVNAVWDGTGDGVGVGGCVSCAVRLTLCLFDLVMPRTCCTNRKVSCERQCRVSVMLRSLALSQMRQVLCRHQKCMHIAYSTIVLVGTFE